MIVHDITGDEIAIAPSSIKSITHWDYVAYSSGVIHTCIVLKNGHTVMARETLVELLTRS